MTTRTVRVRNSNITYTLEGSGPPILMIHAFPLSSEQWRGLAEALAPRATIAAVDLPGFGGSDAWPEEACTTAGYAECAEAVVRDVAPDAAWVLGGCSMGGYVVFELVRRGNVRRRGAILADTRAVSDAPEQRAGRLRMIERARAEGTRAVVDPQLPRMITADCEPRVRASVKGQMRAASLPAILGALHALLTRPDSVATLARMTEPVLALVGEHDPVSPPDEMRRMVAALPNAELRVLAGASHFANLEKPREFTDAVGAFLAGLPA